MMQSFNLNGTEWIAGGLWQDLDAKSRRGAARDARNMVATDKRTARKHKVDVVDYTAFSILVAGKKTQAGFFEVPETKSPSEVKSLATLFAANYNDCTIMLTLDSGTWVCAIEDGLVFPDGDFIADPNEAKQTYSSFLSEPKDWEHEVITDTPEESFRIILELFEKNKIAGLTPVKKKIPKKLLGGLALAILLVMGSIFIYQHIQDKKRAAHKAEIKRIREAKREKIAAKEAEQRKASHEFIKVWESEPLPQDLVNQCIREMKTFPFIDVGWRLKQIHCNHQNIMATWDRTQFGDVENMPVNAEFDISDPKAQSATSKWRKNNKLQPRPAGVKLLHKVQAAPLLYQIAIRNKADISVAWQKREVRTVEIPGKPPEKIQSPFSKSVFSLTFSSEPERSEIEDLSQIPGVMIHDVALLVRNRNWIIKGELYVK